MAFDLFNQTTEKVQVDKDELRNYIMDTISLPILIKKKYNNGQNKDIANICWLIDSIVNMRKHSLLKVLADSENKDVLEFYKEMLDQQEEKFKGIGLNFEV